MSLKSKVDKLSKSLSITQLSKEDLEALETSRHIRAMSPEERAKRIDELIAKRNN